MMTLTITGSGLKNYDNVLFCYIVAPDIYLPHSAIPFIRFNEYVAGSKFSDTTINGTLSILSTAPKGRYEIFLSAGSDPPYDTKLAFVVRDANDGQYADCPTQPGPVAGYQSLFCSEALLDYKLTYRTFGKGIADQFIAVEVTVKNNSDDYEYILHDIRLGTNEAVVASIDKKLVRAVGENTEQFTARAIAVRLTEAVATAFTGVAGVVGDTLVTSVSALVAGPGLLGLKHAIPDLSVAELNRINDLAFATGGIVVAKHAAVPMVAFLSSKIFVPGCPVVPQGNSQDESLKLSACNGRLVDLDFKNLKRQDLVNLQKSLIVQVSGAHVQEIAQVTVTSVAGSPVDSPLDLSKLSANADETITLQGSGLNNIKRVNLVGTGSNVFSYPVISSPPSDRGRIAFTIPAANRPTPDDYKVTIDTAVQNGLRTGATISVVSTVSPTSLKFVYPENDGKNTPQSVTMSNAGSSQMTNIGAKVSGSSPSDFIVSSNNTIGCGATLESSSTCKYDVSFCPNPLGASDRNASLDIAYGAPPANASVSVSGTLMLPSGGVIVCPSPTLNFPGPRKADGNDSSQAVLTITNFESADNSVKVSLSKDDHATDFAVGSDSTCPLSNHGNSGKTLSKSGSCVVKWTFKPSPGPAGPRTATVTIEFKKAGQPASTTITLSGVANEGK